MNNQRVIQTTLLGRLGNQLFIYAATRVMALKSGCDLVLTEEWVRPHNFTCRLGCFNLPDCVSTYSNRKFSLRQQVGYFIYMLMCRHKDINQVHKLEIKYQKFFHKFNLVLNQEGYIEPMYLTNKNWYAFGYFQCDKYFKKHEDLIRKELTFKTDMFSEQANNLAQQILSNTNTVCVHIRRGDYLNDPIFKVCDTDYYYKAIENMQSQLSNATYYVFSDNIDEVRELFSKYDNLNFVYIDSCFTDQESMYLGACCSNFIMTNSSFSWWMQYLSKNKNKIVFAPSRWYGVERPCDIYQDNWQLIEV